MTNQTKKLYLSDSYIKESVSTVTKNKKNYVCLDQTIFYPLGGGQPSDIGFLKWNNNKTKVIEVIKKGDTIKHIIDGEKPTIGEEINCILNWKRRYNHMKMHTAQHIISGIVFDDYNARTVGNQIHENYSRVDFHPVKFSDIDIKEIKNKFNKIIKKNRKVKIYEEKRDSLEKRVDQQRCNLNLLPKFIKNLRIVEIEDFDICPCAGTHVKNTNEISKIEILRKESKGQDTDRIIYSF